MNSNGTESPSEDSSPRQRQKYQLEEEMRTRMWEKNHQEKKKEEEEGGEDRNHGDMDKGQVRDQVHNDDDDDDDDDNDDNGQQQQKQLPYHSLRERELGDDDDEDDEDNDNDQDNLSPRVRNRGRAGRHDQFDDADRRNRRHRNRPRHDQDDNNDDEDEATHRGRCRLHRRHDLERDPNYDTGSHNNAENQIVSGPEGSGMPTGAPLSTHTHHHHQHHRQDREEGEQLEDGEYAYNRHLDSESPMRNHQKDPLQHGYSGPANESREHRSRNYFFDHNNSNQHMGYLDSHHPQQRSYDDFRRQDFIGNDMLVPSTRSRERYALTRGGPSRDFDYQNNSNLRHHLPQSSRPSMSPSHPRHPIRGYPNAADPQFYDPPPYRNNMHRSPPPPNLANQYHDHDNVGPPSFQKYFPDDRNPSNRDRNYRYYDAGYPPQSQRTQHRGGGGVDFSPHYYSSSPPHHLHPRDSYRQRSQFIPGPDVDPYPSQEPLRPPRSYDPPNERPPPQHQYPPSSASYRPKYFRTDPSRNIYSSPPHHTYGDSYNYNDRPGPHNYPPTHHHHRHPSTLSQQPYIKNSSHQDIPYNPKYNLHPDYDHLPSSQEQRELQEFLPILFIGNIDGDLTTADDLQNVFNKFGEIERIDVKKKGFAFVFMKNKEDAEKALHEMDGSPFGPESRPLRVEWAKGDGSIKKREDERRAVVMDNPTDTLFVVNYDPEKITKQDLENHFADCGTIVRLEVINTFCFVQYSSIEEATKALKLKDGTQLGTRKLIVEYTARKMGPRSKRRRDMDDGYDDKGIKKDINDNGRFRDDERDDFRNNYGKGQGHRDRYWEIDDGRPEGQYLPHDRYRYDARERYPDYHDHGGNRDSYGPPMRKDPYRSSRDSYPQTLRRRERDNFDLPPPSNNNNNKRIKGSY